ncbi:helicase SNF2 [Geodermatophilus sp. DF01-2]|uniref:DEAD/DEAH box helicase n=1 Tax=Geodermatophilus sp. DF01-2 TaxID=2559610 RepID=UPI0010741B98|nr:DEAD/DEAH box helicase [Geodermatophilus sp. DF01_2]TFV54441.1 helicase SNF2 [Geodermatophilus sp. DF01_2]
MLDAEISRLSDATIRDIVGADTYRRAVAYVRDERVSDITIQRGRGLLFATVQGTDQAPYSVIVTFTDGWWYGECTCPVGEDCKHVTAVMLAARDALRGSGPVAAPAWERSLTDLLQATTSSPASGTPIALQFELVAAAAAPHAYGSRAMTSTGGSLVRIRPAVPGKKGAWVRTGISWRQLQYDYGRSSFVPAHVAAVRELYATHQAGRESYYAYGDVPVHLHEFGPALWPALENAVASGVPLVPAKGSPGPVRLAQAPADVAVDLHRSAPEGDALLAPVVTVQGAALPASAAMFLGTPAHGIAVDGAPDGLLLAPLARRTTAAVSGLLTRGTNLPIPAADVDRFLRDFYPGLRRVVPVTSADRSVELPEIVPPRLALEVGYAPDHRTTLAWSMQYETGGERRRLPLHESAEQAESVRDRPAEHALLDGLTLPGRLLPPLWDDVEQRQLAPTAQLRGMDAVVFTEEVLPVLRERDDVVVEETGTPPDFRQATSPPRIEVSATDTGDTDWFDLGVTVTVDGEDVPFAALFLALASDEEHLLLPSGTWFDVRRPEFEQLRRLIEEARALQEVEGEGLRISRYQAGLWEELASLGVVEEQSERWGRSVSGLLEVDVATPPAPPSGLAAELRPYQQEGYGWLSFLWDAGLGGILADDMGLGKTVQTLALLCRAHQAGELTAPVLVVAPTSVVSNWAREAARFAPGLRVVTVEATERRRGVPLADAVAGADVVITSYALFRIEYDDYSDLPWRGLVLDEAQFVKNHQARTYACARRLPTPFKLAITGTPLENSLMDLWSMLSITAPGLFPNPQRFSEFYRVPIERGTAPELLATLRRRIRPLMRRRTKEQVAAELPPKQEQVLDVVLDPKHRKVYDTHLQQERRKVLGLVGDLNKNRFTIFRSLTLLRQLSLAPALIDEEYAGIPASKVDAFLEHLREVVAEGHRALVFSQFTGFLRIVRDRLDGERLPYAYLDGRTRNRAARIEEFRSGRAPVFLISLKAGGAGLNLTEADYVFVLDPWWNPAVEAQAVDRAHRIGQDKTVMVYRLVAAGTIEEKVMELKARKQDLFARVMDDDALLSGPLTAEDITGLFT